MRRLAPAILAVIVFFTGCTFGQLKEETRKLRGQWVLMGQVAYDAEPTGDLVAVLYEKTAEGVALVSYRNVPWTLKEFVFLLEPGERDYRAAVFHDGNRNREVDDGETVLLAERGNRLKFSDVTTWKMVKVDPADALPLPEGYRRDLSGLPADETAQPYYVGLGVVPPDLKHEKFGEDASSMGFWEPHTFLQKYGIGVYMLQPYDPDKIPVLFVSGADGNISNWKYFLQRLDRTKYQPWYFLYPSGMRIFRNGQVLHLLVTAIEKNHGVKRLVVMAHSMGGLVAREFVRNHVGSDSQTEISHFVTIATPWAGHSTADDGVNLLSTPISRPIPSWLDLAAGSRFLQGVFANSIEYQLDYHLVFAFMPGTGGDGVVELDSQLLPEAQDEASSIRGFHAGHLGVLFRDEVFEYIMSRIVVSTPETGTSALKTEGKPELAPTPPGTPDPPTSR